MVALSDPGGLSEQFTLFPEGECDHALPPHFAVRPRVSCKVGPEHALSPLCWESRLTTGLSPLAYLESHTQSCTDMWCHSCHAAPGRIPHLPAVGRIPHLPAWVLRSCPRGRAIDPQGH